MFTRMNPVVTPPVIKNFKIEIEVFQNGLMRLLTGNNKLDKIRIEKLNEMTNLQHLFEKIKKDKEYLLYKTKTSLKGVSNVCLEGIDEGKRPECSWALLGFRRYFCCFLQPFSFF